ncbi:MAG: hypothetical protein NUV80_00880 [Candidatus Berkelbacteria bacterium]|nr:hypothetical protein [Candidatus Berkelbacteria bacterium]
MTNEFLELEEEKVWRSYFKGFLLGAVVFGTLWIITIFLNWRLAEAL